MSLDNLDPKNIQKITELSEILDLISSFNKKAVEVWFNHEYLSNLRLTDLFLNISIFLCFLDIFSRWLENFNESHKSIVDTISNYHDSEVITEYASCSEVSYHSSYQTSS